MFKELREFNSVCETGGVYNWLQYFSKESLIKKFEENGLKIVEFYSDVSGKAFTSDLQEIAIVATL